MTHKEAQQKISEILKQLEIDQKCYIKSIYIEDIETTQINDNFPVFLRKIIIDSKYIPGENWYT